jgi:hypothetical protein
MMGASASGPKAAILGRRAMSLKGQKQTSAVIEAPHLSASRFGSSGIFARSLIRTL